MTLTITFPPETESKLRERAALAGLSVEGYVRQLVEREVLGRNGCRDEEASSPQTGRTFDEIFAPLRTEVDASGITDEDLDRLLMQAREEVWRNLMDQSTEAGKDFGQRFPRLIILDPPAFLREFSSQAGPSSPPEAGPA